MRQIPEKFTGPGPTAVAVELAQRRWAVAGFLSPEFEWLVGEQPISKLQQGPLGVVHSDPVGRDSAHLLSGRGDVTVNLRRR